MNVQQPNMPSLFSLETGPLSHLLDRKLQAKLLDSQEYETYYDRISQTENNKGKYDYNALSNLGMVYFYLHHKGSNRKLNTKVEYARELTQFLRHALDSGITDMRDLKRSQIEAYQRWIEERYPKTKTQEKKITILSSFFKWCFNKEYIAWDFSDGLYGVKVNKSHIPDRNISAAAVAALTKYYEEDPKFLFLALLLPSTGMRLNEVITPNWSDLKYDAVRNKYYLETTTKRDGVRNVHIRNYVLEALIEYRNQLGLNTEIDSEDTSPFYPNRWGKRYRLTSLSSIVSKRLAAAGILTEKGDKTTAHFFRHYFARSAFNHGASTDKIAATLGHKSIRTTEENYLARELEKDNDVSEYVPIPGYDE